MRVGLRVLLQKEHLLGQERLDCLFRRRAWNPEVIQLLGRQVAIGRRVGFVPNELAPDRWKPGLVGQVQRNVFDDDRFIFGLKRQLALAVHCDQV